MTDGQPAEILVVDDHDRNRQLLAQLVTQLGHRVTDAGDGLAALRLLRGGSFDLVLLDVLMPQLDGFGALEQVKADPALRAIPVIMISGLGEVGSVVRCIEAGAEDYLTKPFDPVLLRARINACLEKKRLRDAERRRAEELERALAQLEAAQDQLITQAKLASLGTLTAGIAHEIRNPLNFVTNFAQLAVELVGELRQALGVSPHPHRYPAPAGHSSPTQGGGGARDEVAEILDHLEQNVAKIHEHGRRADRIVHNMLLHARGQSSERQRTDLNSLVAEYVQLAYHGLRGQDPTFQVAVETDLDPALKPLPLFAQELSRVVANLTQNACYAAHEKAKAAGPEFVPRVTVRTRDLAGEVEVRFRDNGNGLSPSACDKIFTPFFTTKPAGVGTGLGLSISYDIVVRLHQGRLRAESEEGRYAEFIVTLPRHREGE
jgi:signal transduction histidine kinase